MCRSTFFLLKGIHILVYLLTAHNLILSHKFGGKMMSAQYCAHVIRKNGIPKKDPLQIVTSVFRRHLGTCARASMSEYRTNHLA